MTAPTSIAATIPMSWLRADRRILSSNARGADSARTA
jgi:hypothetical protein